MDDATKKKVDEQNERLKNKIKPVFLPEILEREGKPRELLLAPWLSRGGLAMVYASAGVGKTFFCLNVAYAVASGGDFLKFASPKPARVLYIDGEMSYDALQPRIAMIAKMQGEIEDPSNFMLITYDMFPEGIMPKLSTQVGQLTYNEIISEHQVDLVIVDNISCMTDLVENNAEEWNIMQDWEIYLRSLGVAILLVHHTSKDKKNQRGTVKREDILDSVILLEGMKTEQKNIGSQFKITFTKNRNFFGEDAEPFEASLDDKGNWVMKSDAQSISEKVIEFSNLGMSQIEIAIELGVNKSKVCRYYNKAKQDGLIKVEYKAAPRGKSKSKNGRHWEDGKED